MIDEGTSAIDSAGTKQVLQNLLNTPSTVIMIAHNYSTELVSMFDRQIKLTNRGDADWVSKALLELIIRKLQFQIEHFWKLNSVYWI